MIRALVTACLFVAVSAAVAQPVDAIPDSLIWKSVYVKHDYRIPMRDGVKLYTVVYSPKDTSESHPILMVRTPYSAGPYGTAYKRDAGHLTREYMRRGYILVYQDVRGKYMSEGEYEDVRPLVLQKKSDTDIDESSDTYDTVDWLVAHLRHNNGRVGVKGISYPGFYTTMATINAHPAVKATSPQAPVSEWMGGDDWVHHGAFLVSHAFDFLSVLGWPRPVPANNEYRPFQHGTPDGYQFFMNLGALPNANLRYFHDSVALWNAIMNHGTWDSFWASRTVLTHLTGIRPATLVVGGWFDTENLYGALHTFAGIEHNNPGHPNTLVMGPWAHSWWPRDDISALGPINFGSNLSRFFADSLEVPFFDSWLKGNGDPGFAKAIVFMTGANEWRRFDQWPPSTVTPVTYFLGDNGKLSTAPPSAAQERYDEYVSNPAKPVPYTGEITNWYQAPFMLEDQRFASRRPDVLVYESDVLSEPVTAAGPLTVRITGSTSGTDCDWIVKLIDVFPDTLADKGDGPSRIRYGGYQMLVRGDVLRAKFRSDRAKPVPVKPNTPTEFPFTLEDVCHRFLPGHRIMVQVQSTWFPMIDRNPGVFVDIYHAKDSGFRSTVQRVYHSAKHRSSVTMQVLP